MSEAHLDISCLFEPLRINKLELANRFVLPGMQRGGNTMGSPSEQTSRYYRARAAGGMSLIITESTAVNHSSATGDRVAAKISPATFDAWRRVVNDVHDVGGAIFLQLWHEGAFRSEKLPEVIRFNDGAILSPSGLMRAGKPSGRAATLEELAEIRAAFVQAAVDAQSLGFDGVEVHAAHGYFLHQFLWSETNRRTDGYGGDDIRDRVRFPAEIVAGIRAATGPDFPISIRFSNWSEVDYGAMIVDDPDELGVMLAILREAGVDIFNVSTRRITDPAWPGSDLSLAGWTKRLSDAPVIAVGSVGLDQELMDQMMEDPEVARLARSTGPAGLGEVCRRLRDGELDLVAVGRSSMGDADWVNKVREGRYDEIRPFSAKTVFEMMNDMDVISVGAWREKIAAAQD